MLHAFFQVGIYAKQNSFWFQAKSANTLLKGNVFFNGPRAGINFNDGTLCKRQRKISLSVYVYMIDINGFTA